MHMRTFIQTAPDFTAIFAATASGYLILDTALMIVDVNGAYLELTRRNRESVLGRYLFDAFPANPLEPEADGVKTLHESLERVLQTGVADRLAVLKYDIPTGTGDDGAFEERYWSPINTPVFDDQRRLTHIIHHAVDITEQVLSENALRESERRFRALTNATTDVIYWMSPNWTHMHQLDGRGFLKDTTAFSEYRLADYVPPEDLEFVRTAIERAVRNKSTFELEHRVLRTDGNRGWTYSKAVPILDAGGEIREWIGSASDITVRKLAEEQLTSASRRKDEFLAMLAHELRNPLAPISAAADLLQLAKLDDPRIRQTSEIIARQVRHMTGLVDDLLDVSRVTRGLITLQRKALDVKRVVSDAVEQVGSLIEARRHRLTVHLPPESACVSGDAERLVQVITNLLNNAARYTPEGGTIDLRVDLSSDIVAIVVKDNGIGIAPDFLTGVFDMFSQAQRTADRSQGGLGIGLALVKSLVELHQGSVAVHSGGLGEGSEFTVQLPRLAAPGNRTPQAENRMEQAGAAGLRLMVVDDNVDAASMLAMFLEAAGHRVIVENDSRCALQRACTDCPDVFLLDIGLPDMDGNELARRLRAQPGSASSMLIAVTGYGLEQDRTNTAAAGFDHHFVKPVDMAKLTVLLGELAASKAGRAMRDGP